MSDIAKSKSLTEAAYLALRADILGCRLPPGHKIHIKEVAASRGVSLSAIREALSRLSAEGLVIAEAQRGFTVPPVSQEDLVDLTSTRVDIENACLQRAVRLGGIDWEVGIIAAFERLSRTPERLADDPSVLSEDWALAHKAFHAALVAACDSVWRLRLRVLLYDQSERYRRLSVPGVSHGRDLEAEHGAIKDAALARDEVLASRLMAEHLTKTASRVIPLTAPPVGARWVA